MPLPFLSNKRDTNGRSRDVGGKGGHKDWPTTFSSLFPIMTTCEAGKANRPTWQCAVWLARGCVQVARRWHLAHPSFFFYAIPVFLSCFGYDIVIWFICTPNEQQQRTKPTKSFFAHWEGTEG